MSPAQVDEKIIANRISAMRGYLQNLEELKKYPYEEFTSDFKVHGAAERYLQLAIECIIDIGNHIISALQLRKPERYRDIPFILGEAGVIPQEFAGEVARMIGLRNILIHDYVRVELEKIHSFMQRRLTDFKRYMDYVIDFIKKP